MVNFLSPDDATDPEQFRAVYGPKRFDRLAAVKKRYDPANVFRFNHNVRPAWYTASADEETGTSAVRRADPVGFRHYFDW